VGVGAAEGLLRVNCALPEAGAEAEFVRGGEGDRVGLNVGGTVPRGLWDTAALAVMVVEPPVCSTVRAYAGKLPCDHDVDGSSWSNEVGKGPVK
jgi:hypothetical protein